MPVPGVPPLIGMKVPLPFGLLTRIWPAFGPACGMMVPAGVKLAREHGAQRVFLEVRPSNTPAVALYHSEGFNEIGRRPRYYPAVQGREDAIVMAMELVAGDVEKMPPL